MFARAGLSPETGSPSAMVLARHEMVLHRPSSAPPKGVEADGSVAASSSCGLMIKPAQDWDLRRRHIYLFGGYSIYLFIPAWRSASRLWLYRFSSGPAAVNLFPFLLLGLDEAAVFLDCALLYIVSLQVPRRVC